MWQEAQCDIPGVSVVVDDQQQRRRPPEVKKLQVVSGPFGPVVVYPNGRAVPLWKVAQRPAAIAPSSKASYHFALPATALPSSAESVDNSSSPESAAP